MTTQTHETAPVRDELLLAARDLGPLIREQADQGERERRLPVPTATSLRDAGFLGLCRPQELGGLEADPVTLLEVVEEIARHDGSAAWCALNCSITAMLQAFLVPEGAREIGTGDDVVANGVIAPTGRARRVEGGYRVSGRWGFVSNCDHCTWLAPTSIVFDGDAPAGDPAQPELVMTWVEAGEWRVIDTWDTAGLRATGSHDIEVADVFVPARRSAPPPPGDPVVDGALFRFPVVGLFAAGMAASALGVAQAAIDELLRLASAKTPFGMTSPLATRATAQAAVCDALARIRSARALLAQEAASAWEAVRAGAPVTPQGSVPLRIAATHATAAAAEVVDRVYTTGGSTALFASSPLQRCLRDVHAITQHLFVAPPTYEMLGKVLLGVEPDGFLL